MSTRMKNLSTAERKLSCRQRKTKLCFQPKDVKNEEKEEKQSWWENFSETCICCVGAHNMFHASAKS